MKKALVTGAGGFIGSHLVEMLLAEGYHVRALCRYNSLNSWGWLDEVKHPMLEVVTGDVRDAGQCRQLCREVDVVFHLAALIGIPYSYMAPESYFDTNALGTLNICQAAREKPIRRLLITSTSEVYGTARYVPIDEQHPRQPQSPYSASKIAADALALSFHRAYGLPVTIVRPFNTFGPRQSSRAVLPTIITQIASGMRRVSIGSRDPTRDFLFVRDTCRGFIELANCDAAIGHEVNIATGSEISIGDAFDLIADIMSPDVTAVEDEQRLRPAHSEVLRLCGDCTKLTALTGFKPTVGFRDGLLETIAWFTHTRQLDAHKVTGYTV